MRPPPGNAARRTPRAPIGPLTEAKPGATALGAPSQLPTPRLLVASLNRAHVNTGLHGLVRKAVAYTNGGAGDVAGRFGGETCGCHCCCSVLVVGAPVPPGQMFRVRSRSV